MGRQIRQEHAGAAEHQHLHSEHGGEAQPDIGRKAPEEGSIQKFAHICPLSGGIADQQAQGVLRAKAVAPLIAVRGVDAGPDEAVAQVVAGT